jgi:hypothetical protein
LAAAAATATSEFLRVQPFKFQVDVRIGLPSFGARKKALDEDHDRHGGAG